MSFRKPLEEIVQQYLWDLNCKISELEGKIREKRIAFNQLDYREISAEMYMEFGQEIEELCIRLECYKDACQELRARTGWTGKDFHENQSEIKNKKPAKHNNKWSDALCIILLVLGFCISVIANIGFIVFLDRVLNG